MVAICKASKLREPSCLFRAARRIFLLLGLGLLFLGYGTGKSVYVKLYALACILVAAMSGMGDMSYLTGRKSRAGWTSNQNHTFRFDLFICAEIFCFLAGIAVFVMIGLDVFALSLMLILINTSEYANIFMNARCFYKSLTDGGAIIPAEPLKNPPRFDRPLEPGGDQEEAISYSAAAIDALNGECEGVLQKAGLGGVGAWKVVMDGIWAVWLYSGPLFWGELPAFLTSLLGMMATFLLFGNVCQFLTDYIIGLWGVVRKNTELQSPLARPGAMPSGLALAKKMSAISTALMIVVLGTNIVFLYCIKF